MSIKRLSITEIGYDEAINIGLSSKAPRRNIKAHNILGGIKHLIGQIISVDEDWVMKSKDWPYLWTKK